MKFIKKLIFFGIILVLLITFSYLGLAYSIASQATYDTHAKSDAILVLGARSYVNGNYNPCLLSRMQHAVELYKAGQAEKIIVSGGDDHEDHVNEGETMKRIARTYGINADAILVENKATSTYENFLLSKEILKTHNLRSVIIVTEPFHMARASGVARKLDYTYTVSPAVESPCWTQHTYLSKYFLKEPVAYLLYKLQGKL